MRAIQITTAAGACSFVDIAPAAPTQYHGFVAQEQFRLNNTLDDV